MIPWYRVDAFVGPSAEGNPAVVCCLPEEAPVAWMQSVAAEMAVSETAFVRPLASGFGLRWFTPTMEVPLCGHATVASAHVLWATGRVPAEAVAAFSTLSGSIEAKRSKDRIWIDLPALRARPCEPTELARLPDLERVVGVQARVVSLLPSDLVGEENFLLELNSPEAVLNVSPDLDALRPPGSPGVIVTAPGDEGFDFVSRYFVPAAGVDEDPATGSNHACLGPYWGERLGKRRLRARQLSARGGEIEMILQGARVAVGGGVRAAGTGEISSSWG
jgi:PhzF family phenazine biosynthesis protein